MLAGDADRERVVRVLKDAFAQGRLSLEEYEDRVGHAYEARTYKELDLLTGDIPRPRAAGAPDSPAPPYPPPPSSPLPPPPKTNSKAIGSLVASLVGGFLCGTGSVVGVVLGHIAKREIKRTGERGDGPATAGLVIGYLGIAFWAFAFVVGTIW
ncbi:DUF1707 and DUF4190 domain-containing protein [Streptomyces polygonati]|uniref:DUF1707 and DUF4190 domain-containing protein n=1 Tax=Streptomyces polygonati TaxID=1617087 RepID=A0ABV8HM44_9ACTN